MFKNFFALFCCLLLVSTGFTLDPVVVVLGPPGAGKGTVAQLFKEKYGYGHLDAGGLVRQEIERQTPIGLQIAEVVKRGDYIDIEVMRGLMITAVRYLKEEGKPFVIDGFGGNSGDIAFLASLLKEEELYPRSFVLFLDAPDEVCKKRMGGRLFCPECKQIYNSETIAPRIFGLCDFCGTSLIQRNTDTPETIAKRVSLYRERVEPNYRTSFSFFPCISIDAGKSMDELAHLYEQIAELLPDFKAGGAEFIENYSADFSGGGGL